MKITKKWLSIGGSLLLAAALLLFILLKYPFHEVISTFSNITPKLLILYLLVSFSIMMLFTIRWNFVMKTLGYKLPIIECLGFRIIDYGLTYITPSGKAGGEPIRAALLTRKGIPFKQGMANVTTDKTIELSVSIMFFVSGLLLLAIGHPLHWGIRIFLLLFSGSLIFLVWKFYSRILKGKTVFFALYRFLRLHKIKFFAKYEQAIIDFEKPIIKFYNEEKKAFFIALGLSLCSVLLSLVEFKLVLLMLGINAPLGVVFMVLSVVGLAFMVPVPMALGSLEAFQAGLFSVLGISSAAGVGLAMITRARDMVWVLIAITLSLYIGSFKIVFKEAYNSIYTNPINKVTIFRNGKPINLKIKMFRNGADNFVKLSDLKKRQSFWKRKKGGFGGFSGGGST